VTVNPTLFATARGLRVHHELLVVNTEVAAARLLPAPVAVHGFAPGVWLWQWQRGAHAEFFWWLDNFRLGQWFGLGLGLGLGHGLRVRTHVETCEVVDLNRVWCAHRLGLWSPLFCGAVEVLVRRVVNGGGRLRGRLRDLRGRLRFVARVDPARGRHWRRIIGVASDWLWLRIINGCVNY
jgi:hypothetical protein